MKPALSWLFLVLFLPNLGARADQKATVLAERAENFELAESRTYAPVDVGGAFVQSTAVGDSLVDLGVENRQGLALSATVYFPSKLEWLFRTSYSEAHGVKRIDDESSILTELKMSSQYTGPALSLVLFTSGDKFLSGSLGGGAMWRDYRVMVSDNFVASNDTGSSLGGFAEGSLRFHAFTKLVFGLRLWGERCEMNLRNAADKKVIDQSYTTAWEVAFAL